MKTLLILLLTAAIAGASPHRKTMILESRESGKLIHVALLSKSTTHVKVIRNMDDAVFTVAISALTDSNQETIKNWNPGKNYKSQAPAPAQGVQLYGPSKAAQKRASRCQGGVCR